LRAKSCLIQAPSIAQLDRLHVPSDLVEVAGAAELVLDGDEVDCDGDVVL
jgi:hypothetical protein